tara:strand:- start:191 stop:1141 length:951 start_codon:yes stop_codon:yes gene_type:complete
MSKRLNILYLVNRRYFLKKLARERFLSIDAIGRISNVKYWGIGWNGYNQNLSVSDNLKTLDKTFDIVIAYKPLEMKGFKDIPYPKCLRYNEMWDTRWTLREIGESGCELVICHHLNDCNRYKGMNINGVRFIYVGHCIEPNVFKDYKLSKRFDLMLGGHISHYHYPLRARLRNILISMKGRYRIYIHPHPGYDLDDAHTNKYLIDFAKRINESRIAVTCSSKYRYRLGKYVEIPACNTVIAGDLPGDNADNYNYIIQIDNTMSDSQIRDKLTEYLEDRNKYEKKLSSGKEFVKDYTWDKYAERVISGINIFLNDRR